MFSLLSQRTETRSWNQRILLDLFYSVKLNCSVVMKDLLNKSYLTKY